MEEVAHDPVPRRPAVALTGAVVDAEVSGVGRGLTALGAETHDRNPRRPTDLSIAALLGSGLDLSFGGEPKGQSCSSDRKSTRLNSSHVRISYAVFCLKKKKNNRRREQRYSA